MNPRQTDLILRLRTSVNCLGFAVDLLRQLNAAADRAEALEIIERQAQEAETTAAALEAAAEG
jgi:hypothetical protein